MTLFIIWLSGCVPKTLYLDVNGVEALVPAMEDNAGKKAFESERFDALLTQFTRNCTRETAAQLYGELCERALHVSDAKTFFMQQFDLYELLPQADETSILTGYFEPLLYGSRSYSERFRYPLYEPPSDLLHVTLSDARPSLRGMRLRGRLKETKIVPYASRKEINEEGLQTPVVCWVDDRLGRFFLEVQGSGRVELENGETIYVGYADQNGHEYRSIGKELVARGAIAPEAISLLSIRSYFEAHPQELDAVLSLNPSFIFFKERPEAATGSLGVVLTPMRSVAVDPRYIPMGAMLSLSTADDKRIVFAEDTGGAIRGRVRADLFTGFGTAAMAAAQGLKAPLRLWIWLPKR